MLCGVASDVRAEVEELCSFRGRLAGTDAERRAANGVAAELRAGGRRTEVEPTYVQPQWALVHFLHCALAAVASMIAGLVAPVAFVVVLLVATSAYLDLSARFYFLRRLLFRRASQNVYARSPGEAPTRVLLVANVDAPRTGAAYNRGPQRLLDRASRRFPVVSSPTRVWFWSIALLVPPLGARMAGLDADWLAALQLPQTLVLIVSCFALGEIALSPASPGANVNASGVAAVLAATRRLDADPPASLAVDVAVCGAGETTMQGMRAFVRSHRKALRAEDTVVIALEAVGRGDVRFAVSQGPAVSLPMDRGLVDLGEALALADAEGAHPVLPIRTGSTSAAFVAAAHKLRAIGITSREEGRALPEGHHTRSDTPAAVDAAAIERASAFAEGLVRLLDRDLSRAGPTEPAGAATPIAS